MAGENPNTGDPPQEQVPQAQALVLDTSFFSGLLQNMQQQNADNQQQLALLREQLSIQEAARQASEAQTQQLIANQAAALKATQEQQAKDFQAIAATMAANGPNQGLPPDVLATKSYPKIEEFKVERNEDTTSRLKFFVFSNALQNRLELHAKFRATVVENERLRAGESQVAVTALIKQITDTYARCLHRKAPTPDVIPVTPESVWVQESDKYLAELLVENVKAVTFQLAFQNHRGKLNRGAYCYQELREIFDPQDLAAALVVMTQFTRMQCDNNDV